MNTQDERRTRELTPREQFFLQYGSFLNLWNLFELRTEFLVWHIKNVVRKENVRPLENCREFNHKEMKKKDILVSLLKKEKQQDVLYALDDVLTHAERHNWIHGHIMWKGSNPGKLVRFNSVFDDAKKNNRRIECKYIDDSTSPFISFLDKLERFFKIADERFDVHPDAASEYVKKVLAEQDDEDAC